LTIKGVVTVIVLKVMRSYARTAGVPMLLAVVVSPCLLASGCGVTKTKTVTVGSTTAAAAATLTPDHEHEYPVPSGSMEPTLAIGTHVLVRPITSTPQVGEIVVFYEPKEAVAEVCGPKPHIVKLGGAACSEPVTERGSLKFIKRIVAGPGDTIAIADGHVIRNGVRAQDSYIKPCGSSPECNFPTPIKIPPGHWFMLGDNRGESDDSRFWGPVPTDWIIGVAHPCSRVDSGCVSKDV
jgi:signal peptidase I